ncbi:MAG: DUF6714 family protein [Abditibacteriaceae bacterium]
MKSGKKPIKEGSGLTKFQKAEVLKEQIEEAFKDVSYPGDNNIVVEGNDPEGQWIKNDLRGTHWKDLLQDENKLFQHYPSILFFTPQALKFFLPAYLIASTNFETSDMIGETLINTLTPRPYGLRSTPKLAEFTRVLTPSQNRAVKLFLEFIRDEYLQDPDDTPSQALRCYWNDIDAKR